MSTIAPGRLFNVADAASFVALSQQNWFIASEALFRSVPTYQNGSPNTLNGPPTSGAWNVGDFWRDQTGRSSSAPWQARRGPGGRPYQPSSLPIQPVGRSRPGI